jgi:hypothetical protein
MCDELEKNMDGSGGDQIYGTIPESNDPTK